MMPNTSVVAGTTAYINCRVLGYPIYSITWELDSVTLPTIRRQQVLDNGTLIIQDVSKAFDEGTYKCVARNSKNETASRTISIHVMVPPLIDPFVFPRLLYEGMRARVSCVVTKGDLPITFSWLKDHQPLENDFGVTIRQDDHFSSSITFSSIRPAHSGNYSCIAKNSADTVNHTASLLVNVPPRWVIQPIDKTASFHSTVTFDCEATGTPTPKINWKKAWSRGRADYRDVLSSIMTAKIWPNNTLVLEKVTESDEGYYLCEANNGVGTGQSKVVQLIVHAAPYFESLFVNYTVRSSHNAHLSCRPKGDLPISITWFVNNLQIDPKTNPKFEIHSRDAVSGIESELTLNRAQRSDTAIYRCRGSNAYGMAEASFALLVQEIPGVPTKFNILDHTSRHMHLEWTSPFDGNSPLIGYIVQYKKISENWKTGGHNVSVDSSQTSAFIRGLIPGSSYNVRVMAQNGIGVGEASDSLGINTNEEAPSGPPLEVEATGAASQTLKVTWKPPRQDLRNGIILGYYVGYRPYDSNEAYMLETVTSISRGSSLPDEVLLKALKKFTKYGVIVKAFNSVGTGPNSDEIVALTPEDVPSEPPQNIRCSSSGPQTLHVAWAPPSIESQNGVLQGYKIFYSLVSPAVHNKPETKFVMIAAKSHETSLTGLEKFSNYSVQISAVTQVGDGVLSDHHYCRTREDVPGAPNDIKALVSSPTSILITWTSPKKPNGIIKKYNVYWRFKQDTHKRSVQGTKEFSRDHVYDIQGLMENTRYDFWVTASTAVGEGESTGVISQSTHHKVPARIASFSSKTTAAWRSNAKLSCFSVGIPAPSRQWATKNRVIPNSDPYTIYDNGTLVIHNVERGDVGNYSCRVENTFGADEIEHELIILAPPLPPSIIIHKTTQNSIYLTWKSRDENNYLVSAYKLKYKRDFGGWEEITVDASKDQVVLKNLHCGTRYQVALQAENSIGHGEISKAILVTTKGSVPRIPAKESVLKWNLTSANIRLAGWPDGGCPVRHYVIQYRPKSQKDFILVSNNVVPEQEALVIGDLKPMVHYVLHITVHNDAGSAHGEYEFTTGMENGENFPSDDAKLTSSSLGLETSVIVAVTFPCILLVTVLIIVCLVIRRKKLRGYQQSSGSNGCRSDYQPPNEAVTPEKRQLQTLPLDRHFEVVPEMESPVRMSNHVTMIHDDVCPYATFNLPRSERMANDASNPHLHLRAFSEGQDSLKQKRYMYDNEKPASTKRTVYIPSHITDQRKQNYRFGSVPSAFC
ncbi:Down syndrome cell adhesion molecule-like protein 1, variant 2 [Chamberlinius hualienensis]